MCTKMLDTQVLGTKGWFKKVSNFRRDIFGGNFYKKFSDFAQIFYDIRKH